jgi:hypothetical protein
MGSCECDGPGDCKTCGMNQFAKSLMDVMSKKYKSRKEMDKELEKLGVKKEGENTYVVNL